MSTPGSKRNREDNSLQSGSSDTEPPAKKPLVTVQALQDMAKVKVGEDDNKLEVQIPTVLLISESRFFKSAFSDIRECGLKEIDLGDEPDAFAIFVFWLFNGKVGGTELPNTEESQPEEGETKTQDGLAQLNKRWNKLINCFILGDMLESSNFCNTVMDELITLAKLCFYGHNAVLESSIYYLTFIYENTTTGSLLRSLTINLFLANVDEFDIKWEEIFEIEGLREFIAELMCCALKKSREYDVANNPWLKSKCTYHKHPDKPYGYCCN